MVVIKKRIINAQKVDSPKPIIIKKRIINAQKVDSPKPIIIKKRIDTTLKKKIILKPSEKENKKLVVVKNDEDDEDEDYVRLSQDDHVLRISDMYIGSDQQNERSTWIYDLEQDIPLECIVTLPQGVERIFLEALSNAGDNALRSMAEKIDPGIIDVKMDAKRITIRNGGKPIPIRMNKKENLWNPELIFGVMLTSSNYNTSKDRIGCGRNGVGIKTANIYSKFFSVTIGDPINGKHYYQEWCDNMKKKKKPVITDDYSGESFVEVSYHIDFERFGYSKDRGYPDEAFGLFARYVYDYSQTTRTPTCFNGKLFQPSIDPRDHARFYFGDVAMILHYEWLPGTEVITRKNGLQQAKDPLILPLSVFVLADTPRNGKAVSFVNGMMTFEGGVHVNEAMTAISKPLLKAINNIKVGKKGTRDGKGEGGGLKEKKTKLTVKDVKQHISLLLICQLKNPQFGGQMKEKLVKPKPKFNIPEKTLMPITKWSVILHLTKMIDDKIGKLLATTNGKKKKHINSGKGRDANLAGGPQSRQCVLFIVEGDSAKNYAYIAQGLIPNGPDYVGILPIQGKPLNVMNAMSSDPTKIVTNREIGEIKKYLGLEDYADYHDAKVFNKLRYGELVILADADDDGTHIKSLIVLLFKCFYPTLLELDYVSFLRTPLIRSNSANVSFYSQAEYTLWCRSNPNVRLRDAKWCKGLGSSTKDDVKKDMLNPKYVTCVYDEKAPNYLDLAFDNKRADDRKNWLRDWNYTLEDLNIGHHDKLNISELIDKELIIYAQTSIRRAIPSLVDGLKEGQRKILWAGYLIWGSGRKKEPIKVSGLGAYVVEHLEYHHGEGCLDKAIIAMGQTFVGSNNMNYLYPEGLFGSREEGGKDASQGRYIFTKLEWWFPYIFKKEDMELLEYRIEDGKKIEPKFMLPILPMHIINGAKGVGTGWSSFIPNHNPLDVCTWYKARLKGEELPKIIPWYQGFAGSIELKNKKGIGKSELRSKKEEEGERGFSVVTRGLFEARGGQVTITELPIGLWNLKYHKWLETLLSNKEIQDFSWHGNDERVCFKIAGFNNPTYKNLKLEKSYGMTNMVLLDQEERPVKYQSVDEIMETFYQQRLPYFEKRKKKTIEKYQEEIARLDAKARYILAIREKKIDLNAEDQEIEDTLVKLSIPNWVRDIKTRTLARQGVDDILKQIEKKKEEMSKYEQQSSEDLWYQDIVLFEKMWLNHQQEPAGIKKPRLRVIRK